MSLFAGFLLRPFGHYGAWRGRMCILAPSVGVLLVAGCGAGAGASSTQHGACKAERSARNEFGSPIAVTGVLSRAPAIGEDAALVVVVKSAKRFRDAALTVELSPSLSFVEPPAHASLSHRPSDLGLLETATVSTTLVPGSARVARATVRGRKSGYTEIRARATAPIPGGIAAGEADIFVTVGVNAAESHCGASGGQTGSVATVD